MNGVIVTGMEIPKTCEDCMDSAVYAFERTRKICTRTDNYVTSVMRKGRHKDCPLKSVEGLLKKIDELSPKATEEDYLYECNPYKEVIWQTLIEVDKIIKEYCEVTE